MPPATGASRRCTSAARQLRRSASSGRSSTPVRSAGYAGPVRHWCTARTCHCDRTRRLDVASGAGAATGSTHAAWSRMRIRCTINFTCVGRLVSRRLVPRCRPGRRDPRRAVVLAGRESHRDWVSDLLMARRSTACGSATCDVGSGTCSWRFGAVRSLVAEHASAWSAGRRRCVADDRRRFVAGVARRSSRLSLDGPVPSTAVASRGLAAALASAPVGSASTGTNGSAINGNSAHTANANGIPGRGDQRAEHRRHDPAGEQLSSCSGCRGRARSRTARRSRRSR